MRWGRKTGQRVTSSAMLARSTRPRSSAWHAPPATGERGGCASRCSTQPQLGLGRQAPLRVARRPVRQRRRFARRPGDDEAVRAIGDQMAGEVSRGVEVERTVLGERRGHRRDHAPDLAHASQPTPRRRRAGHDQPTGVRARAGPRPRSACPPARTPRRAGRPPAGPPHSSAAEARSRAGRWR